MSNKDWYKFIEVSTNTDGDFLIQWAGTHPDQGGLTFRKGSIIFSDLKAGLKFVESTMRKHDDFKTIAERIQLTKREHNEDD